MTRRSRIEELEYRCSRSAGSEERLDLILWAAKDFERNEAGWPVRLRVAGCFVKLRSWDWGHWYAIEDDEDEPTLLARVEDAIWQGSHPTMRCSPTAALLDHTYFGSAGDDPPVLIFWRAEDFERNEHGRPVRLRIGGCFVYLRDEAHWCRYFVREGGESESDLLARVEKDLGVLV